MLSARSGGDVVVFSTKLSEFVPNGSERGPCPVGPHAVESCTVGTRRRRARPAHPAARLTPPAISRNTATQRPRHFMLTTGTLANAWAAAGCHRRHYSRQLRERTGRAERPFGRRDRGPDKPAERRRVACGCGGNARLLVSAITYRKAPDTVQRRRAGSRSPTAGDD